MYRFLLCCLSCLSFLLTHSVGAESPPASNSDTISDQILGFDKAQLDVLISKKQPATAKPAPKRQGRFEELTAEDIKALGISQPADRSRNQSKNQQSQPSAIGMTTGKRKSTYHQMGLDIARLAASKGLRINTKPSSGSLDNLRRMVSNENAGLAIVQSDVIEFLSDNPSPANQTIINNLTSVFSLYDEEIHLLARKNIKTLADLNNKRVIVGELGSGTPITANIVFDKLGIDIEPVTGVAQEDALKKFILGDADAIFFIGGKPISYINGLLEMKNNDKLSKYIEDIHLLPLDDERLHSTYKKVEINPSDYQSKNGLYRLTDKTVPTVAAQALLVSFDFSKEDSPYYKLRCQQLNQLNSIIRDNLEKVAASDSGKYHSKWAQVNLNQATNLPASRCINNAPQAANDIKAIDCYLQTGSSCK